MTAPTQVRRPWRATARTAFQAIVALAVLFPVLVETAGLDPASFPWLAVPVAVAAGFARVMALPQVEVFLRRFVPWLAAAPTPAVDVADYDRDTWTEDPADVDLFEPQHRADS